MGGAELVSVLIVSFSFICSLMFVTFPVSCFQVLIFRVSGFGVFGGLVVGLVGGAFFNCQLYHKAVFWTLLGVSEAQLILQEG